MFVAQGKFNAEGILFAAIAGAFFGVAAYTIHYMVHQKLRPALTNGK